MCVARLQLGLCVCKCIYTSTVAHPSPGVCSTRTRRCHCYSAADEFADAAAVGGDDDPVPVGAAAAVDGDARDARAAAAVDGAAGLDSAKGRSMDR